MRLSSSCINAVVVVSMLGVQACDGSPEATPFQPAGPELSARSLACDFGRMSQDARSYFPGNGRGSISATVQDLIDEMEDACANDNDDAYTAAWFEVAGIVEQVLADGTGGDPVDGASFLNQSVSVLGPDETTPIFDPCDGLENCLPWDGYDPEDSSNTVLPPFANVLSSPDGAWAVVGPGTDPEAVCSGFTQRSALDLDSPCGRGWTSSDPDIWGVEPTTSWGDALWDRTSLLFGYPSGLGSPTGETVFGSMSAYDWLLIPYPSEFGSDDDEDGSELLVSFCATGQRPAGQYMVQKGSTILTEENESVWCPLNSQAASAQGESLLRRLAAFLSPLPAPLNAVAAVGKGPGAGGLAGSFTDFYGVNIPTQAVLEIPVQPADGSVNQPITDRNGNPFRVLTYTSSMQSPLENARVDLEVIGNLGLIPAGASVSGAGLTCSGLECFGFTQADEDDDPGTLELPLVFTKTGQYSLCFTAELSPLQFGEPVCTEKFNIRP